jgi:hypothetical protein
VRNRGHDGDPDDVSLVRRRDAVREAVEGEPAWSRLLEIASRVRVWVLSEMSRPRSTGHRMPRAVTWRVGAVGPRVYATVWGVGDRRRD